MPLYSIPDMKIIKKIPHERDNITIIKRIPKEKLELIIKELNHKIDEVADSSNEIVTSGWIPGNDWTGSVWEPIYIAAERDFSRAGMIFGALVFEIMMKREEDWSLGKYQVNGRDIGSTTYFRIHL